MPAPAGTRGTVPLPPLFTLEIQCTATSSSPPQHCPF